MTIKLVCNARDTWGHLLVPCCLPSLAWGVWQNQRGRVLSDRVWWSCVRGQNDQKREMQFASFEDLIWFWSSALALRHSSILETSWATFALTFIKTILVSICPLAVAWGLCQNQRGRTSSDVWAACVRGPPSVSWLRIFHPYSCTFLSPPWKYHLANKCTTLICTKLGTVLDK